MTFAGIVYADNQYVDLHNTIPTDLRVLKALEQSCDSNKARVVIPHHSMSVLFWIVSWDTKCVLVRCKS